MIEIYILIGEKQSGKTTWLKQFIITHEAAGILTPVHEGKRYFMNIATGDFFEMEANDYEPFLEVGRYKFSQEAFQRAEDIIRTALSSDAEWIVIDEIGPLELNNLGFYSIVMEILEKEMNKKILLVVRSSILEEVIRHFNFENYKMMDEGF